MWENERIIEVVHHLTVNSSHRDITQIGVLHHNQKIVTSHCRFLRKEDW
jgi:hypothetical protein